MPGIAYIGQAGTGKTTSLMDKLDKSIDFETWPDTATILAMTFMHGSRRRLEDKLKPIQKKGVQVSCKTIDSFCLNVLQRYKSYLGINVSIVVDENPGKFYDVEGQLHVGLDGIRDMAIQLLKFKTVKEVLSFSYPIIVVDEFQDCDGQLLEIVKKLNDCSQLFLAADDFQNLSTINECPATDWLAKEVELNILERIWRTNESKILDSSRALRLGKSTNNGIDIKCVPSKDVAAYMILSNMQWYNKMGSSGRSIAIISPVGPKRDAFVRQTLERIQSPMVGKGKNKYKLGSRPYFIEGHERITTTEILSSFEEWEIIETVSSEHLDLWKFDDHLGFGHAVKKAKRLMKLRNTKQISKIEFSVLISSGIHFVNTFLSRSGASRMFLTIHGAKNREFDDVFLLWPRYTLPKGDLYLRKLMYNAITRAKRSAIVIVQGPNLRLDECPLNLLLQ